MADAAATIEKLLNECNATLKRNKNHLVYEIPGVKERFTMPHVMRGGGSASKNALSQLRRILKTIPTKDAKTVKDQLLKLGLTSTTQKRIEGITSNYRSRAAVPYFNHPSEAVPTIVEKVTSQIQGRAIAKEIRQELDEKAVRGTLERWNRQRPTKVHRHRKDAAPVRSCSAEEIAEANLKLQNTPPPREAWIPPVEIRKVGDEMIVVGPSMTFIPEPAKEDWMSTIIVEANIATWKAQAEAKRTRALELMTEATKLDNEAKTLDLAAQHASEFVADLKANEELLTKNADVPNGKSEPEKHERVSRKALAGKIEEIVAKADQPVGTGELRVKLQSEYNKQFSYNQVYEAAKLNSDKIVKLDLGYWIAGRSLSGRAAAVNA